MWKTVFSHCVYSEDETQVFRPSHWLTLELNFSALLKMVQIIFLDWKKAVKVVLMFYVSCNVFSHVIKRK